MKPAWVVGNGLVVLTALACVACLYYTCRPVRRGWPVFSLALIAVTVLISILQFIHPELLAALRRDPEAVRAGEWWRLFTALFVQPEGLSQCLANGLLMLLFVPPGERLYGGKMLVVYFTAGLCGQIVDFLWNSGSGGSSTAVFGVMGSLLIYVILNRARLLRPFQFIAHLGLLAAVVLIVLRDARGVSLVIGAAVAALMVTREMTFRSLQEVQ
jgi:membrane associated rhomboid family serine protease